MNHRHRIAPLAKVAAVACVYLAPIVALAAPGAHAPAAEASRHADSAVAEHAAEHSGHAEPDGIVWVSDVFGNEGKTGLLFILFNFAVLLYLLNRILFKPLRERTHAKHAAVKSELEEATAAHKEARSMVDEYRDKLDGLNKEAESLMKDARERAEADRKRIIEAAEREAEQIKAAAKAAAERDAESHRSRLEAEVVDRAVERAEKILRERIGPADQRTMVDDFVARLGTVDFSGGKSSSASSGGAA